MNQELVVKNVHAEMTENMDNGNMQTSCDEVLHIILIVRNHNTFTWSESS